MQLNLSFLKQKFHLIPNLKHLNEILQAAMVSVCAEKRRKEVFIKRKSSKHDY